MQGCGLLILTTYPACVPARSRERERGQRFSTKDEDVRVSRDVEDLFTEAARVLSRTTRRYPVNISSINDIMRHRDRSGRQYRAGWGCGEQLGEGLTLCCMVFVPAAGSAACYTRVCAMQSSGDERSLLYSFAIARPIRWFDLCCAVLCCACRNWHCGRVCGVTFATLCRHMMRKGVVTVETKGYTVMVT
jgi:hypothetical protein